MNNNVTTPSKLERILFKGQKFLYFSRHREALQQFQAVLDIAPEHEQAHYLTGLIYFKLNQVQQALKHVQNAYKQNKSKVEHLQFLYVIYNKLGKEKERRILQQLLPQMERSYFEHFQTRRYIRPEYSLTDFFNILHEHPISYVVLRWFDNLPHLEPGEDLDILIADEDIDTINPLFTSLPLKGSIPVDLYSCSGVPGTAFEDLPYYPRHLAEQILENRVMHPNQFYVPEQFDHFHSLAFHALYHKDVQSGLPIVQGKDPIVRSPGHDYRKTLFTMSRELGLSVPITMNDLHVYLAAAGWAPSTDQMRKFGMRRDWVQAKAPDATTIPKTGDGQLAVFVVKEWAATPERMELISRKLDDLGFDIVFSHTLTEEEKANATKYIRSGNWNEIRTGIWKPFDCGPPTAIIVVYDAHPMELSDDYAPSHPYVTNERIRAKEVIRDLLDEQVPLDTHVNPIHSSDDELEALEYIDIAIPTHRKSILNEIDRLQKLFTPSYPLIQNLHQGVRSRVDLIEYRGGRAVQKTFRESCSRFLKREIEASSKFHKLHNAIPEVLESGDNYLIKPYYDDELSKSQKTKTRILQNHIPEIGELFRLFYQHGYMHLDIHPGNFLYTSAEGLKLVDFEFLQPYHDKVDHLADSYDLQGVPSDTDYDQPRNHILTNKEYDYVSTLNSMWKKATGYTMSGVVLRSLNLED